MKQDQRDQKVLLEKMEVQVWKVYQGWMEIKVLVVNKAKLALLVLKGLLETKGSQAIEEHQVLHEGLFVPSIDW